MASSTNRSTGLIVSLDTKEIDQAIEWKNKTSQFSQMIKIGMEFTYAQGLEAASVVAGETPLFLDLKLYDIPNTVSSAIRSLGRINPSMLTIHASGGRKMIEASRKAIDETYIDGVKPLLLAVTVLTSFDDITIREVGIPSLEEQVIRLGKLAIESGADGLVCSPHEIGLLRDSLGEAPILVVPGIRPEGYDSGDQRRVMTPSQAREEGADWIVVGRPITRSDNPEEVAKSIYRELNF